MQVVFTHCEKHLRCCVAWGNTSSYMQMQKAVRSLPVAVVVGKFRDLHEPRCAVLLRLLIAAALLEEGESLLQRIATAASSAKASAKHLCLMT
jgi:hypothetical protein